MKRQYQYQRGQILAQMIGDQLGMDRVDDCGRSAWPDLFDTRTAKYVEVKERWQLLDYANCKHEPLALGFETGLYGHKDIEQYQRFKRMTGIYKDGDFGFDLLIVSHGFTTKRKAPVRPGAYRLRCIEAITCAERSEFNPSGYREFQTPAKCGGDRGLVWHLSDFKPVDFDLVPFLERVIGTEMERTRDRELLSSLETQRSLL